MRCLVTGAAGFVGSTLSDQLLRDGHTVIGIDCFHDYYSRAQKESNLRQALTNPHFTFLEGDLNELNLGPLLEGVEWVFHQAGQPGVRKSWGEYFQSYSRQNIQVTQRLLEALKGSPSLQRFVYASSSSIYGNAEKFPTEESIIPLPVSPYGVTKLAAEHLATLYGTQFGIPTVSLRYFTVFGPRQRPDMSFHRFIRAALEGGPIEVYGDGHQSRSFTYIDDIVRANILAAQYRGAHGAVFNIGGGNQASVNDVLELIQSKIGKLNVTRLARQDGDALRTSADITRARRELGYDPRVSLVDGISAEIEWMRQFIGS